MRLPETLQELVPGKRGRKPQAIHPVRLVPTGFVAVIVIGTLLLSLPAATATGKSAPFLTALFTAVSATCVTGLVTVDTGTYWSAFGQGTILLLIQIGGLGTLLVTTLLLMAVSDRLSLGSRLLVGAENRGVGLGSAEQRLRTALGYTLAVEASIALVLWLWWMVQHGLAPGDALWMAVFHSISAFNNAGFGLRPDSLIGWSGDPVVLLALSSSVILGGIGLPVIAEIRHRVPRARWSVHTRLTIVGTLLLLTFGTAVTFLLERGPSNALHGLSPGGQVLNAFVHSVMLRTAGFNAIDMAALSDASILAACILMVIGGGSVGTAGGIKVTTFMVIALLVAAELRGHPDSVVMGRRLPASLQREALTIATIAALAVGLGCVVILSDSGLPLRDVLFETSSAFATVGLSTGITAKLPPLSQLVIILLMFLGRVGPITLGAALALRTQPTRARYPEERPIIG